MTAMFAALLALHLLVPTAPLDLTAGHFDGVVAGGRQTVLLPRRNLLTNASFEWDAEVGNRGVQDGLGYAWALWGSDNAYGLYSDRSVPAFDLDAIEGARSQKIVLAAAGQTALQVSQDVYGLVPEASYTFSVYARLDDPQAAELSLSIMYLAGDGQWFSEEEGEPVSPATWQRLQRTGSSPQDVRQARCRIVVKPKRANAQVTVWLDAAQFEAGTATTDFTPQYSAEVGEWTSDAIDLGEGGQAARLAWIASEPAGTAARFQLRSGANREALVEAAWRGPEGGDWYGTAVESGPNLVGDERRSIGYGDNDRQFAEIDGALRATIQTFQGGNGRWQAACPGEKFAPGQRVRFEVFHREDRATTPVAMSVAFEPAVGETQWGRFTRAVKASTEWRTDAITFQVPQDVPQRIWLEIALQGAGWVETKDYDCRALVGDEIWAVNPADGRHRFVQVRAMLSTADLAASPIVYQLRLDAAPAPVEVRWFGLHGAARDQVKYRFVPGEIVTAAPEIACYPSLDQLSGAALSLVDPDGRSTTLDAVEIIPLDRQRAKIQGEFALSPDAPLGEWRVTLQATTKAGVESTARAILKVGRPYLEPPARMRLTAIVGDYGFARYKGQALDDLIALYRSAKGLDGWLVSPSWSRLEPAPGQFDPEVVAGLQKIVAAAGESGVTARIAIQQQYFPAWVNDGSWDNDQRYRLGPSRRLADTWARLAAALKDVPGLDGYQLINEENVIRDADHYLRSVAMAHAAIRAVDPDLRHTVVIRPNSRDPYLRTRIASDGAFDYDHGSGGYPTHSSWYFKRYAHPISRSSFMRMVRFRLPATVLGGPGGIGEIGFFNRQGNDDFGDEAKLLGFQRGMRIAWQMGMDEYCLWSGTFSFDDLPTYMPKLAAFRDELVKTPRPARFDVALVMDDATPLYVESGRSDLDMDRQPLAPIAEYLDGQGYVWYVTDPAADAIQHASPAVKVLVSTVVGKPIAELERQLAGIKPSGEPLPWPVNDR